MSAKPILSEGEKILERIRKQNRAAAERAAKWDRDGRTDAEVAKAYHDHMAEKRKVRA